MFDMDYSGMDAYRQRIYAFLEEHFEGKPNLKEVSNALGKNDTYMQQFFGRNSPRILPETVRRKLSKYLGKPEDDLRHPEDIDLEKNISIDSANDDRIGLVKFPMPVQNERNLPVLGAVVGGDGADSDVFLFNGQVNEYVVRPPQLRTVQNGYAVYIFGDSMEPVAYNGQIAYVNPNRPPRPKRLCVVELHDGTGYIKEFVKRTPTKLVVRQLKPEKNMEFDSNAVKHCHYVPIHGDPD